MKQTEMRLRATIRPPELRLWEGELVVDNFAGGGGASTGIERALGRPCNIAINHDAEAIAMHKANHPDTHHYIEDIWQVDPKKACAGHPVRLAWFSPDCKHFSKAKGAQPKEKKIRGMAWVVIRWAKAVKPRVIMLENVEEFETWGPVDDHGRPCPTRIGSTFKRWITTLRNLGYSVEWRPMQACEYGAPTTRRRLFIIARCDGEPIRWPAPTHGPGLDPFRTAAECIDWSVPCPSIFERSRPLAENTLARIANGIKRYVIDEREPFIVRTGHYFAGRETTFRGQGLRIPLATVCATNDKNLVLPSLRRVGATGGGSADPLVAAFIAKHYTGVTGHSLRRPLGTITARDHHALVTAFLLKYYGDPAHNLQSVKQPLHTITAKARFGLVQVAGTPYEIVDIGMRMLEPRELFTAQGFPESYEIAPSYQGRQITKTAQIRLVGNSVCPDLSDALVRENLAA
jgi:DNA (cytosine-5)-methyltransferase 1